jgi:hypothetical protein
MYVLKKGSQQHISWKARNIMAGLSKEKEGDTMDRSNRPESMGAYTGTETFLSYLTFMRELRWWRRRRRRRGGERKGKERRRNMSADSRSYTI